MTGMLDSVSATGTCLLLKKVKIVFLMRKTRPNPAPELRTPFYQVPPTYAVHH